MTNYFAQIRKTGGFPQLIKELSDRISRLSPAPDDSTTTIRHARVDVSKITYSGSGTAYLDSSEVFTSDTDALAYTVIAPPTSAITQGAHVFEDSTGGNLKMFLRPEHGSTADVSGTGLTVTDGASLTLGAAGAKFIADANSLITVTDNAAIMQTGDWSISLWAYLTDLSNDGGVGRRLLGKKDDANNGYYLITQNSGAVRFAVKDAGTNYPVDTASSVISANTAFHVGVSWDDTAKTQAVYVNGAVQTTSASAQPAANTPTDLIIGQRDSAAGRVNGYLWDIRFYNTKLTATEFANIYAGYSRYGVAGIVQMSDVGA